MKTKLIFVCNFSFKFRNSFKRTISFEIKVYGIDRITSKNILPMDFVDLEAFLYLSSNKRRVSNL